MSRKSFSFAILPILVNGETTGYLTYKSGQFTSTVTFEVQCIFDSPTENTLIKTYGSDCRKVSSYVSDDNQWVQIYEVRLQLSSALDRPKAYLFKIARSLSSCTSNAIRDAADIARVTQRIAELGE